MRARGLFHPHPPLHAHSNIAPAKTTPTDPLPQSNTTPHRPQQQRVLSSAFRRAPRERGVETHGPPTYPGRGRRRPALCCCCCVGCGAARPLPPAGAAGADPPAAGTRGGGRRNSHWGPLALLAVGHAGLLAWAALCVLLRGRGRRGYSAAWVTRTTTHQHTTPPPPPFAALFSTCHLWLQRSLSRDDKIIRHATSPTPTKLLGSDTSAGHQEQNHAASRRRIDDGVGAGSPRSRCELRQAGWGR